MARLIDALRRAFGDSYSEPVVHFHAAQQAHEVCYIANSVTTAVTVE